MARKIRKKGLKQYSEKDLVDEIARRHADKHFREGMTMSEMDLSVEAMTRGHGEPSIARMLSEMKPENPTAKACPKCGKRTPVKARDRERTVKSLAGLVTFQRNYHYFHEECRYGFYPVDRLLMLPEEGDLSERAREARARFRGERRFTVSVPPAGSCTTTSVSPRTSSAA